MKTSSNIKKIEMRKELNSLKSKVDLMEKLSTKSNFFKFYFENLKNFKSQEDCFNYVNEIYNSLFGQKRYENYQNFFSQIS